MRSPGRSVISTPVRYPVFQSDFISVNRRTLT